MKVNKPSLARGTRDFGPEKMAKRNYIFETIKAVYKKFGFEPLETPAIENLSVLMGKYGEEGDQLLFKILNSGNFSEKITENDLKEGYKSLTLKIAEKGLKYDLTVPFARFVAMNRGELVFPFKRYQIQPVWRADRPQKGRYREFYQCDADVVGTNSLLCEAEILAMMTEVYQAFGFNYQIKINNRKILTGITQVIGANGKEADFAVAIDKLDKIGKEAVLAELATKGFDELALQKSAPIFDFEGSLNQKLAFLNTFLAESEIGLKGVEELKEVFGWANSYDHNSLTNIELDITLARGLSYYTGCIFEVKALDVQIGSITGGGRYDDLTEAFGLPNMSGVGISFGVDCIYDVLEELNLFPSAATEKVKVILAQFDEESGLQCMSILKALRKAGIKAEMYPEVKKLKNQIEYADCKSVEYFLMAGSEEFKQNAFTLKNLTNGEQQKLTLEEIITKLK